MRMRIRLGVCVCGKFMCVCAKFMCVCRICRDVHGNMSVCAYYRARTVCVRVYICVCARIFFLQISIVSIFIQRLYSVHVHCE